MSIEELYELYRRAIVFYNSMTVEERHSHKGRLLRALFLSIERSISRFTQHIKKYTNETGKYK